jgi:hypothetical protein
MQVCINSFLLSLSLSLSVRVSSVCMYTCSLCPSSTMFCCCASGKIQKMSSLLAGYCSARFNHHFGQVLSQHIDETNPCLHGTLLERNRARMPQKKEVRPVCVSVSVSVSVSQAQSLRLSLSGSVSQAQSLSVRLSLFHLSVASPLLRNDDR